MHLSWPRRRFNVAAALFAVSTATLLIALCDTIDALRVERAKAPVSWNYTATCPLPRDAVIVGVDTFDRVEAQSAVLDVDDGVVREHGVERAAPKWWTTLPPGGTL